MSPWAWVATVRWATDFFNLACRQVATVLDLPLDRTP